MTPTTPITTDQTKVALHSFVSAARAGQSKSAPRHQEAAFRFACLLQELDDELIYLPDSVIEGFLELIRLSAGRPCWDNQKIRITMLSLAAVKSPVETFKEYFPQWKEIYDDDNTQLIEQLIDEICEPGSITIGGKSRQGFDPSAGHSLF